MLSEEEIIKYSVPISEYQFSCIYFLIQGTKIVYVGQSTHGIERVLSHKDKIFDRFCAIKCKPEDLDKKEMEYIFKFKPIYNRSIPNNDRYKSLDQIKKITGLNGWKLKKLITDRKIKQYWPHYYDLFEIQKAIEESKKKV